MLGQPFAQPGGPSANREVNNQSRPIRYSLPACQIAQQDFVPRAPDFLEFVIVGGGVGWIFTPNGAFFLEVALRAAIDIRIGEAIGKIERFQDHRNGIACGADHCADRGHHADEQSKRARFYPAQIRSQKSACVLHDAASVHRATSTEAVTSLVAITSQKSLWITSALQESDRVNVS